MLTFIMYEGERYAMEIADGETVGALKDRIKLQFQVQDNDKIENTVLNLSFAGSDLQDHWVLMDLGITPGETIKAGQKEEIKPVLYVYCVYNEETVPILDQILVVTTPVQDIRTIVAKKTGLPVSVFRLLSPSGRELYDNHEMLYYDVNHGDTIRLETWDGWNDFLNLASLGFTNPLMKQLSDNEHIARFQMKVAMYMAAHYGHTELASTLMKQGIRPEEPIGEHPARQWCASNSHIEILRPPVHEATEMGQLNVLRVFVSSNICVIVQRDGHGLMPLNVALRKKIRHCAGFLIGKQWSRITLKDGSKTIPLTIFHKLLEWGERAREKALLVHGHHKTTLKRKAFSKNALVGNGCQVNGFSKSKMTSRTQTLKDIEAEERSKIRMLTPDIYEDDPESYFKALNGQLTVGTLFTQMQNRRVSKWGGGIGNRQSGGGGLLSRIRAKLSTQEKVESQNGEEATPSEAQASSVGGGLLGRLRSKRASNAVSVNSKVEPEAKDGKEEGTAPSTAGGGLLARLRAKKNVDTAAANSEEKKEESEPLKSPQMKAATKGSWLSALDTAEKTEAAKDKLPPIGKKKKRKRNFSIRRMSNIEGTKLPNIKQTNKVSQSQQDINKNKSDGDPISPRSSKTNDTRAQRGFVLRTPKGQRDKSSADEKQDIDSVSDNKRKKERSIKSAVRLAKARNADGSIPLPMSSHDTNRRPFYYIASGDDEISKTLEEVYTARGVSGREKAIETLSMAQSFKEKPWLGQVRQALEMSSKGIRRLLMSSNNRNRLSKSVQGTADTGI